MARPRKQGLDYFSHDTEAVNDEKIDMLRAVHQNDGYAFYFITLERVYRTDVGELDISTGLTKAALARKVGVSVDKLQDLIETALEVGLFDREAYEDRGCLTSNGIKRRLGAVLGDRFRRREAAGSNSRAQAPEGNDDTNPGYSEGFDGKNPGNTDSNSQQNAGMSAETKQNKTKQKETELPPLAPQNGGQTAGGGGSAPARVKGPQVPEDGTGGAASISAEPTQAQAASVTVKCYSMYGQNIGLLTPIIRDEMSSMLDDGLEDDLVCEAIREATASNARNWRYIKSILHRCLTEGKVTLDQYRADAHDREIARARAAPTAAGETQLTGGGRNGTVPFAAPNDEGRRRYGI